MKKLNVAAILMCLVGALGVFEGVWGIAATESYIQEWAEMMGTTVTGSAVLTMAVQFFSVYHLIGLALLAVIGVIPLRRAEKWAWLSILVFGAISFGFGIALWFTYAPFLYAFFAMWIAALALSAKPCLSKKG